MFPASQLLGPPEIYNSPPPSAAADGDNALSGDLPMGFTENNSLTYLATGNPCLDFFFHIVPNTPSEDLIERLTLAWDYNPLTTLKLVCNLRGVRGTGKSDKESFYTAALWLHKNHPKTLACNLAVFADFGYFKDLLEILYRILEGPDVRSTAKMEWESRKKGKGIAKRTHVLGRKRRRKTKNAGGEEKEEKRKIKLRGRVPRNKRIEMNNVNVQEEKERARVLRNERDFAKAKKAFERYSRDPHYRFLHDQISTLFADILKSDIRFLNSGEAKKISLAAKWCPTIDSSYDKTTLIYESIARRVFPRENYQEYEGIEEAHYVYRARDRLRKEVVVPLRRVLQLPEVYMSAKQWNALPYNRVASVAMKNYKDTFLKHDSMRFEEYLENVKRGKATIAAGALLPHEIIASLGDGDKGKVAELQWERMVDDLAKMGKLRNCIAVCDVSGSMSGTPMEVCVALGLLISELSDYPWKGNVITFSENPRLHKIRGDTLLQKSEFLKRMDPGANTDFQRVFDRILQVAINGKLSEDEMIKRVFVFSNMEFDQASGLDCSDYADSDTPEDESSNSEMEDRIRCQMAKAWETDYEVIRRKFREKGYSKVPEIVFWNLSESRATLVSARQNGVALVSGFSKDMVTLFLEEGGLVHPVAVMEKAIAGELYQKLVVLD